MKTRILRIAAVISLAAKGATLGAIAESAEPQTSTQTSNCVVLSNGIRIVSVYFPGSTNVSIYSFLPLGLTWDGPHQAQWSHLVEHLVIRSTVHGSLSTANAETLPDHMRLDFYGNTNNWQKGLEHHRRWLEGVPFSATNLPAEKRKVKAEGSNVAGRLFTGKFALAAWAQGFRHGLTNASVQGDIDRASLEDIQTYRDHHLVVLSNIVVCVVGGIPPAQVCPVVAQALGAIKSTAVAPPTLKLHPGNREMTWDLPARHVVITWPIPDMKARDFPALLVSAQWLNMQLFQDSELKAITGQIFAGADLTIPEGNFFYVSASLRPQATAEEIRDKAQHYQKLLSSSKGEEIAMLPQISQQLAENLRTLPDLAIVKSQMPATVKDSMIEGNMGLQWGMNEFRYGDGRTKLVEALLGLKIEEIQRVSRNYLEDSKRSVTVLQPATP